MEVSAVSAESCSSLEAVFFFNHEAPHPHLDILFPDEVCLAGAVAFIGMCRELRLSLFRLCRNQSSQVVLCNRRLVGLNSQVIVAMSELSPCALVAVCRSLAMNEQ